MRVVCAWCQTAMGVRCDHCNAPLLVTSYVGSTFEAGAMVCLNGETPVIYSRAAIETMPASHGMCAACGALTQEERDAKIAALREKGHADFAAAVVAETAAIRTDHEAETRSPDRAIHRLPHEKRGPKGVPQSATARVDGEPKKDGGDR